MSEPPRKRLVRPPAGGDPTGRAEPARLKTAKLRTPSSQAWLERQINDPFAAAARAQGWRSRAAFKLIEIDDKARLIRRGSRVIDLGCAPGGWLQVAIRRGATKVAGVDLLPVESIPGAQILQADFTDPATPPRLMAAIGGPADLILSDMAPNTTGLRQTDHLRIVALIEAAAAFAQEALAPGGAFVAKAFQGGETGEVLGELKRAFREVRNLKPKASRPESAEVYIVATGFKGAPGAAP